MVELKNISKHLSLFVIDIIENILNKPYKTTL